MLRYKVSRSQRLVVSQLTVKDTLLNHTNTTQLTNAIFHPEIQYLRNQARKYGLDFVLSEVGNTIGSTGSSSGDLELAASLGAAVWTVDMMLNATSIVRDALSPFPSSLPLLPSSRYHEVPLTLCSQIRM